MKKDKNGGARAERSAATSGITSPSEQQASVAHPGGVRAREPQATIAHPGAPGRQAGHQDDPADDPPRKRGGQPSNTNAVKHGFYSTIFKENERRLLAEVPLTDLTAEIELIRVTNKRFLEALSARKGDLDFETQLTALRAVNLSAHSIATLLRTQALTTLRGNDLAEALSDMELLSRQDDPPSEP